MWDSLVAKWWRIHLQCRRHGFHPWVRKIPWRRKWQPIPVFLPGESCGWRSLVGPWGHKRVRHGWEHTHTQTSNYVTSKETYTDIKLLKITKRESWKQQEKSTISHRGSGKTITGSSVETLLTSGEWVLLPSAKEQAVNQESGIWQNCLRKRNIRNFPGGPGADSALPMQGAQIWSLVKELDPMCYN